MFASAVTTERAHSQQVFAAVDDLVAESAVDYAAAQPTLSEANFVSGLDQNGLQLWDAAFASLEQYAQHVAALASPDLSKDLEEESVRLGGELQSLGSKLQREGINSEAPRFNPTLAAGITELGSLIIRLKAQADTRRATQEGDPYVRKVFLEMAASIGDSSAEGVRGTVKTHWNTLLAQKKAEFLEAKNASERREIAASFQTMLKRRTAQDSILASLHQSLTTLADLHHALAKADAVSVHRFLDTLVGEMNRTTQLKQQFQPQSKP
jgi:hypothetical protein